MDEADQLARSRRGAMVAAAGCGKTHLIATAVSRHGPGRQLVLTHTHAGVDVLRQRLRSMHVAAAAYHVDTIAGWALRYTASFPATSGLPVDHRPAGDGWDAVYGAATGLLNAAPIREVVRCSYAGAYIDEYQDCTIQQHALVMALAEIIPCRVLGDPLQAVFNFGKNECVRWPEHVAPNFERIAGPDRPWRWQKTNPKLGSWLQAAREALLRNEPVAIDEDVVSWRQLPGDRAQQQVVQRRACFAATRTAGESVVAIHQWPPQCHALARALSGTFSCVEPIDCEDLFTWAKRIDSHTGLERASDVVEFACECMAGLAGPMTTVRKALAASRPPKTKGYTDQVEALMAVARSEKFATLSTALDSLAQVAGVSRYRRELLAEMKRAAQEADLDHHDTLHDAAWAVRSRTRVVGRPITRRCMGRTLLVKGLEFAHAIVLDADKLDRENLYVAITRGAKSLTILSHDRTVGPHEKPRRVGGGEERRRAAARTPSR